MDIASPNMTEKCLSYNDVLGHSIVHSASILHDWSMKQSIDDLLCNVVMHYGAARGLRCNILNSARNGVIKTVSCFQGHKSY